MARIDDLRTASDDQLTEQLGQLKREQFNLRFQAATSQLERPSRVREVRRDIARIKTLQNQRSAEADRGQAQRSAAASK
jgi:large subunit ribosomal protein L29